MTPLHDQQHRKVSAGMWVGIGLLCYLIPLVVLLVEDRIFGSWPVARFLGPEGLRAVRFL